MFKNKFILFLVLLGAAGLMTIALFWRELVDSAADTASGLWSTSVAQETMRDADLARIKEVRFEGEHNNPAQISVGDLKIVDRSDGAVTLSVRIASKSGGGDFPSLRVAVLSRSGVVLRTIEFGPSEYAHGGTFSSDTIELRVPIRPGDASFSVSAFYKD